MGPKNINVYAGSGKVGIILLGIVVLGVGLHSHFKSAWFANETIVAHGVQIKHYQICNHVKYYPVRLEGKCPAIAMEQFYVITIIISFALSIVNLIVTCFVGNTSKSFNKVDCAFHIVFAIALLIAACLYMVSAKQIRDLGKFQREFLLTEKYIAGALTVLLAVAYIVVGVLTGSNYGRVWTNSYPGVR